jgi:hypothetical protein
VPIHGVEGARQDHPKLEGGVETGRLSSHVTSRNIGDGQGVPRMFEMKYLDIEIIKSWRCDHAG